MVNWFVAGQRWSTRPKQLDQDGLAVQLVNYITTLDQLETLKSR